MALAAGERLIQVVMVGTYDGQDYRNVWHFRPRAALGDAALDAFLLALANAILQCWVDVLIPSLPNIFNLSAIRAKQLWPVQTDVQEVVVPQGDGTGGVATDGLPGFASQGVFLRTGFASKRKRGRIFLPAPPESGASGGTMGVAQQDQVVQFLACLAGKFLPGGNSDAEFCVYSRVGVGARPPHYENGTLTPVTVMTMRKNLYVLRRRRIGTGS